MVSRDVSPRLLKKSKKHHFSWIGFVLVLIVLVSLGFGGFKILGPKLEKYFKIEMPMLEFALDNLNIEESKAIFKDPLSNNDDSFHVDGEYEVKDLVLYGEVLTLYSEKYDLNIHDELRGKSIMCRNMASGSEYVYYMGSDLDSGLPIYELPVGVYAVYLSSLMNNERIYMSDKVYDEFYSVTRKGVTHRFRYIADQNYFYPHDETMNSTRNYLYFWVEEANLPEEEYDVIVDPGHFAYDCYGDACYGYLDNGNVSSDGNYVEAEMNYELALVLKEKLEEAGLKVLLTRDDEIPVDMYGNGGRVEKTIKSKAKLYISLHLNSLLDKRVNGSEVIYSAYASSNLAENILNHLVDDTILVASGNIGYGNKIPSVFTSVVSASQYGKNYDSNMMIREPGGKGTGAGEISEASRKYNAPLLENVNYGAQAVIVETMHITNQNDCRNWKANYESYGAAIAQGIIDYLKLDFYKLDYLY